MENCYIEGYLAFKKQTKNLDDFYHGMNRFKQLMNDNSRNIASHKDIKHLEELELKAELSHHLDWTENFADMYIL